MIGYIIATAIVTAARIVIGIILSHDVAGTLGVATGMLTWGLVPAAIYWVSSGRRKQDGKMRTARVMFWWSFITPYVFQSFNRVQNQR
jgi:hypothetical protein